jgi:membrane complex biogenesis BtpA family protein
MFTWFESAAKPLLGMLHVPPLPGSPRYAGPWPDLVNHVLRDAEALVSGGMDGLLIENYGDAPFFPDRVPAETTACLTALAAAVRGAFHVPLGINVLRNDGETALAIAVAVEAQFIRVNVLCGARLTDQGIVQGRAHALLRLRRQLQGTHIRILADVNVKHSAPLAPLNLEAETDDLLNRGGAEGVIVSGSATGMPADLEELKRVRSAVAGRVPVLVGSGVTAANIASLQSHADGFIVGSSLKQDGRAENPVDSKHVRALRAALCGK